METERRREEIEIDVRDLLGAVFRKLWLIILVGVIVGAVFFAYTKICITPKYTSSTQVYILNAPDSDILTTNDITFATYLARDYQYLIVSTPVLKEVIEELDLNMTTKGLASLISVNLLENSRILQIDVTSTSPQLAKEIADKIRDTTNKKTKDAMGGIEAVNAIDEASLPINPSSPNAKRNAVIGFLLAALIVLIIVVVSYMVDDTIKTQEDIEKYLGLSLLASIPLQKEKSSAEKRKKN